MSQPLAIDLKGGFVTLIDEGDASRLEGLFWYRTANGYVGAMTVTGGKRTAVLLHRHLTDAPPKTHVDHINGNPLDNRRDNLRIVTPNINQVNRKRLNRNNSSGVRGVVWIKSREVWLAQIMVNRRNRFLGYFTHQENAITARRAAEVEAWGEQCPVP
jgi:hypothetical protein